MRTWERATRDVTCGYCRKPIGRGEPVLVRRIASVHRAFLRCPTCAGEPVPTTLAPLIVPAQTSGDFSRVTPASATPAREWTPYRDDE